MRKGNSTGVDKGQGRRRADGVERVDGGGGGGRGEEQKRNMLRAVLEGKISGRLQRGFYCKIHASQAQRAHAIASKNLYARVV